MTAMTSLPGCPNTYHARVWTGDYCNSPLKGSGPKHKPDLILVDRIKRAKTWNDVNALAELTTSLSFTQIIRKTLVSKSYLIFKAQEDRRYVITVAICGTKFYLSLFDRAGVCHSQGLDINDDAEKFLLVLVGLSFTSRTWLGYDPTIISHLNGAREVLVTKTYKIQRTIFRSDVLRGWATICWHGTRSGEDYAIEDTWADTSRDLTEKEILEDLSDIDGVPKVVEEVIVEVDSKEDSTGRRRWAMADTTIPWNTPGRKKFRKLENRVHRRLVLQPLESPWYASRPREN